MIYGGLRTFFRLFLFLFLALTALVIFTVPAIAQDATLSGTVVDVADGVTPVHPVAIDLLDQETGDALGLAIDNQPDGSYLITAIPPGQYKVLFNAVDAANDYIDELFDEIPCNNGGCDRAGLGNLIDLQSGANVLDEELLFGATLSGTVVDAADGVTPVHPVAIDLLDPVTGDVVGLAIDNQPDGSYRITAPSGQYKVLFNAVDAAKNYNDELFDEIPCDNGGCDRAGLGNLVDLQSGANVLDEELLFGTTLSGTVVDAADGVTPVYPVYVALIDPVTGADHSGLEAVTDSEGYYEITAIPAGDYKVHFNAVDTANGYVDELYNGIPCDDGGCGMDVLGDVISFANDAKTLNIDLERAFLLSGIVSNQAAQPIANLNIEVFDDAGNWICCNGTTNGGGEWSLNVTEPGDYYVRTANFDTQGYLPEIWDNVLCDDCDPVATGTAVVVTDGDVGGIDFELSSVDSPSNTCGSGDVIMAAGFEDLPAYTISFTSDASSVMTGAGQQAVFSVEYLDEQGNPLNASTLEWCLEDETHLSVNPSGLNATVESTGFELGSKKLVVRDPLTSISATASILFADLQPDAIYIGSDEVVDNGGGGDTVILLRNASTELIQPGDVLVSGDKAGVLVRVLVVTLTPDQVILTVEPARITDAFENLDITNSSQPQSISVKYNAEQQQAVMTTYDSTDQVVAQNVLLDSLDCTTESQGDFGLTLTGGNIDWDLDIKLNVSLKIVNSNLTEFSVIDNGTVNLQANTGRLSFASELSSSVKCELDLPKLESIRVPVSVFSFELGLQPLLGVKVSGNIEGPSFYIEGPEGQFDGAIMNGIKYTPEDGWTKIKGSSWAGTASLFSGDFKPDVTFGLGLSAYGGVDVDFTANLGWGFRFTTVTLANVEFASFSAEALLSAQFSSPFDYRHKDYSGPNWEIKSVISGEYKAELTGGLLNSLLDRLDLPVSLDIGGTIFDPIEIDLFHSPRITKLSQTCSPRSCYLDPSLGEEDHASFVVQTDKDRSGTVLYLAEAPNETDLIDLTTSYLSNSSSLGEWIPDQDDEEGIYHAYIRLETDVLSKAFPYSANTAGFEDIEITETLSLDVEIIDTDSNNPIEGEPPPDLVSSDVKGIECGEVCSSRFPAGSEVTLTAHESGNWMFVMWGSGGACAGSELRQCTISIDSDQKAKALYQKDIYSFAFGYTIDSGLTFVEMPELYAADGSITLLNSLGYTIALKKEGELVGPFWRCYPPGGIYDEEFYLGCTARFGVPVQSEDEYLGPISYSLTDEETGDLITREINVTISNEAYRNIVGKTYTRTKTHGSFCSHFEEEIVFNSDFTWTTTAPFGGRNWSYSNDSGPHKPVYCEHNSAGSGICDEKFVQAVIYTNSPYVCGAPNYLFIFTDGTAQGGDMEYN